MVKLTLIIFQIFIFQIAYTQVNKEYLKKSWMSIDCIESTSLYNEKCRSKMIIKFFEDSLQRYYAWDKPLPYQINEDSTFDFGNFKNVKIIKLTKDTLKLDLYNSTLVFIPIPKLKKQFEHTILKDLLVSNEWTLKTHYNTINRYEFLDYIEDTAYYGYLEKNDVFNVKKLYPGYNQDYNDIFWTILTLNETTILFINPSVDYFDYSYDILINKVSKDSISGIAWSDGEKFNISLIREKKIKDHELAFKEKILTSGIWKLDDFEIKVPEFLSQSEHFREEEIDSTLILDSIDIVHKIIKYDFKPDHTFDFLIDNKVSVTGSWEFSKSGKILKLRRQNLFEKNLPIIERHIELGELSENELHFTNHEELFSGNYSKNDYSFNIYPVIQKYKNRR